MMLKRIRNDLEDNIVWRRPNGIVFYDEDKGYLNEFP